MIACLLRAACASIEFVGTRGDERDPSTPPTLRLAKKQTRPVLGQPCFLRAAQGYGRLG
jgi:hypothetical protein